MQTREIVSISPSGHGVVFFQELRPDGTWYNRRARSMTTHDSIHFSSEEEREEAIRAEAEWKLREMQEDAKIKGKNSGSHNTHSRLAPSAAKQWVNCTASIGFIRSVGDRLPKDDSSEYSIEGTKAHDYAAAVFTGEITFADIPESFRPHVQSYVEHCRALGDDRKTLEYVESKVPLFYMPHENGTTDYAKVCEEQVWIRDLKYGAGVLVVSEENEQLAIYALSLIRQLQDDGMFDFSPDTIVDIMAYQPRHHEAENATPWVITLKDLEDFCAAIQARADLIAANEDGTLEFHPDPDVCRWCRARALCPARAEAMAEAFD